MELPMSDCQQSLSMSALANKHGQGGKEERPKGRSKNKFLGVRQRPPGRWVAEIKCTTQKIRVWLGTFETAEEAARAYDEATCLLRGSNTRTNFTTKVYSDSPMSKRIRSLLNKKKHQGKANDASIFGSIPQKQRQMALLGGPDRSHNPQFSWQSSSFCLENIELEKTQLGLDEMYESERVNVERQISASFYALNGVHECFELFTPINPAVVQVLSSSSLLPSVSYSSSSSAYSPSSSLCSSQSCDYGHLLGPCSSPSSSLCSSQSCDYGHLLGPCSSPSFSTSNVGGGGSGYLDDIFLDLSHP